MEIRSAGSYDQIFGMTNYIPAQHQATDENCDAANGPEATEVVDSVENLRPRQSEGIRTRRGGVKEGCDD